jgi:hypothetical protein
LSNLKLASLIRSQQSSQFSRPRRQQSLAAPGLCKRKPQSIQMLSMMSPPITLIIEGVVAADYQRPFARATRCHKEFLRASLTFGFVVL